MSVGQNAPAQDHRDPTAEEFRGRFYGRYAGFVMDRDDPERRGRIRCACPSLLPGELYNAESWLGWALPVGGTLSVPNVGEAVWLTFENGSIADPVYTRGWYGGSDTTTSKAPAVGTERADATLQPLATAAGLGGVANTIPADTAIASKPKYPEDVCFEEGGWRVEMDRTPGAERARFRHPAGTTILVDPDGSVHLRSAGAIYNEAVGDQVVQLQPGASFKVIYPGGATLILGASGVSVTAPQVRIQNRAVRPSAKEI